MEPTPQSPRRVVVTGMGIVSPVGVDIPAFWDNLTHGVCGIDRISRFDVSDYPAQIAAEIRDFEPDKYFERKEARHMDPYTQYAIAAGVQAVEDSGIDFDDYNRERIGVIVGSGIGGMKTYEDQVRTLVERGPRRVNPFFIPMMISDIAAGLLSIRYNLRGPNYSVTSACATSGHAIGNAMKTIRWGEADVMVTGGTEAPISQTGLAGFSAMKALSTRNDDPKHSSRPFDADRDGFIMGEGSGILVLESLEGAQKRGARIYCELAGAGYSGDAHHITAPPEDGHGAEQSMRVALEDAQADLTDVGYINAHGTSTPLNDRAETLAIKNLFGEYAYKLAISSTKSMHGHMLGAAAGVETIATILAMKNGRIPPTINYETPDPDCDLNYTPNEAIDRDFEVGMCNTFGFGGHNATLVIKKFH
ncbi:beta-ketoacyl-ACP synthase II [Calditrichota bacterium]